MGRFTAHVQYDDWTGTAAADAADVRDIRKFARENGLLADDEFLVGFEFYSGGQTAAGSAYFSARIFVIPASNFEEATAEISTKQPLPVQVRELNLSIDQFFGLFKRFDVVLTQKGLSLDGQEFEEPI